MHPRLVAMFEHGVTIASTLAELGSDDLSRATIRGSAEHAIHDLLTEPTCLPGVAWAAMGNHTM
ncbi:MAG TPA: hypothetical protein VGL80_23365 [Pseudonocardiaceae bacterium]